MLFYIGILFLLISNIFEILEIIGLKNDIDRYSTINSNRRTHYILLIYSFLSSNINALDQNIVQNNYNKFKSRTFMLSILNPLSLISINTLALIYTLNNDINNLFSFLFLGNLFFILLLIKIIIDILFNQDDVISMKDLKIDDSEYHLNTYLFSKNILSKKLVIYSFLYSLIGSILFQIIFSINNFIFILLLFFTILFLSILIFTLYNINLDNSTVNHEFHLYKALFNNSTTTLKNFITLFLSIIFLFSNNIIYNNISSNLIQLHLYKYIIVLIFILIISILIIMLTNSYIISFSFIFPVINSLFPSSLILIPIIVIFTYIFIFYYKINYNVISKHNIYTLIFISLFVVLSFNIFFFTTLSKYIILILIILITLLYILYSIYKNKSSYEN